MHLETRYYMYAKGYIAVEKTMNSSCHLEEISQPFIFSDEEQLLNVFPRILNDNDVIPKNLTCTWKFLGPKDYGFKIVFTEYSNDSFSFGETLVIRNSSNHIITE